jgi:hypothetical protein
MARQEVLSDGTCTDIAKYCMAAQKLHLININTNAPLESLVALDPIV